MQTTSTRQVSLAHTNIAEASAALLKLWMTDYIAIRPDTITRHSLNVLKPSTKHFQELYHWLRQKQ